MEAEILTENLRTDTNKVLSASEIVTVVFKEQYVWLVQKS